MDTYVTGITIKNLRERKGLTQTELADKLGVSSKAVSKWENAKGLPDISLIEPIANALSVSVMELMTGDTAVSCCGITLPPLEAEETDSEHQTVIEKVEDEQFITIRHEMTKQHYISFVAYLFSDRVQFVKFYPEGNAETRLNFRGQSEQSSGNKVHVPYTHHYRVTSSICHRVWTRNN